MLKNSLVHPLVPRAYGVICAILLYNAGLTFTIRLLTPESFGSGPDRVWLALLPVLLAGFFFIGRRSGCGGKACTLDPCTVQTEKQR